MRHHRDHRGSFWVFRRFTLATQVRSCLLLISVVPLTVASIVAYRDSVARLEATAIEGLSVVAEGRAHYIELYLRERIRDIASISRAPGIPEAMADFARAFADHGLDSPEYVAIGRRVRPFLSNYRNIYGYSDIVLLSCNGDVVFSVNDREEIGSNVASGPEGGSALGSVFDRAKTLLETEVSDYEPDATGEPAAFIAAPVFQEGAFIGVVALQLSNHEVYALAEDYTGLGETGEIVLCMRRAEGFDVIAPTRHDSHAAFARTLPMGADRGFPLQQAALGRAGSGLDVDYRGVPVMAVWRYVPAFRWGMVVKIDARETLAPATEFRSRSILFVATIACALLVVASFITRSIAGPRERVEAALKERASLAEMSAEVGIALTRETTLRAMLSRCAESLVQHLDAAFARIWTLNEAGDVLELQASAGIYTHLDGPHSRVPVGRNKIGLIAQERKPHLTNNVIGDPRVSDPEWVRREGLVAFAGHPLVVQEKLIGVVAMFARHPLSESMHQGMESVASGIALGVEQKRAEDEIRRLNEHLKRRLRRIKSLRRIDMAISASQDLRETLAVVVEQAIDQLGVDTADVLLYDEATGTLGFGAGKGVASDAVALVGPDSGGLARRVARAGCPLYVPDLAHAPVPEARVPRLLEEGIMAYHAVPLVAKGRVRGVLECFRRVAIEPDLEWLSFAGMLGGQAAIAVDNAALLEGLRRSNEELTAAYDTTIEGWSRALDMRDKETEGHSRRVTEKTVHLARAMGVGEADLIHIRRGALLHDIGKLGVPDAILHKPGPLSEAEWVAMRRHPSYALEILGPVAFLGPALDIPHYHHERWDGTGYPCGLAGEQIPLAARIFAAVDIWDALSNDRPYRQAWPEQRVWEHLRTLAGSHLDPRVVEALLGILVGEKPTTNGSRWQVREPACLPADSPSRGAQLEGFDDLGFRLGNLSVAVSPAAGPDPARRSHGGAGPP